MALEIEVLAYKTVAELNLLIGSQTSSLISNDNINRQKTTTDSLPLKNLNMFWISVLNITLTA